MIIRVGLPSNECAHAPIALCMYVAPKIGFNYVMRFLTISAVPNFGPCNVPPLHGHMAQKSLTLVPETYYRGQCCYIVWRYAPSMSLHYKIPKSGFINSVIRVIPGYPLQHDVIPCIPVLSTHQIRARRRIYYIHVVVLLSFQWTVFISNFMHMRDKTVCGFWDESTV